METIGVTFFDPWFILDDEPIIKDLYYFDKLAYAIGDIHILENFCNSLPGGNEKFRKKLEEIEKLEKSGLIFKYPYDDVSKVFIHDDESHIKFLVRVLEGLLKNDKRAGKVIKDFLDRFPDQNINGNKEQIEYTLKAVELLSGFSTKNKPLKDTVIDFFERFREIGQLGARKYAIFQNNQTQDNYTPIIRSNYYKFATKENNSSTTVLSVLLKKFPTIEGEIELDKFITFKKDTDTQMKLARLKDWVLEISKKQYSEKEIEQKIDYLLIEYTQQLELHKLKYRLGLVETLIVNSLEVLEGLLKLNLGKTAKMLFDLRKKDLQLLEEERKITGKELALLSKVNESKSQLGKSN